MIKSGLPRAGASVPRSRARHRGLFWLAVVIATFAFTGSGYLAVATYLRSAEPSDVVISYFTALAAGDGARALSYGPVPAGDQSFLTDDVLRQQLKAGAIMNVQVLSVTLGKSTAQVNVNYQLRVAAGQLRLVTDTVPMVKVGRHWWLAHSAATTKVSLAMAGYRAAFAGTAIPTDSVVLFPGALPITFDTDTLQLAPTNTIVEFSSSENTSLGVEPSAAGIVAARAAVGLALTSCLAPASTDTLCPVPTSSDGSLRVVPGTLHGSLAPAAADRLEVTVTTASDGIMTIEGTVDVDGRYSALDYNNVATVKTNNAIHVAISAQAFASQLSTITWRDPA
jgi:hypothetical protein